jgi:hypothetical protein
MKLHAIFNKHNQTFVGFTVEDSKHIFPKERFNIKTFDTPEETINLARYRVEGSFKEAVLVDLFTEKKTVVTEREIDQKYIDMFERKYEELTGQSYSPNNLLFDILDNSPIVEELRKFRQKLKDRKVKEIEGYKTSKFHIYETDKQQVTREQDIFK